jgi:hypothetical protein
VTPRELARECKRVIDSEHGLNKVFLTIPGPPPRGQRVRLDRTSRRKCPMGEVANWQDNPPRTVAYFDALDVLAWLAANGLVDVAAETGGER